MIINSVKQDVVVGGNFKTSSFKVQASAKAFEILSSNIYTHKVRAVIREISCNAYDAHVAAKTNRNFEVHLPTYLEPWFSVRDYGTGLSDGELREIFTTYFCSTKTNSNDFVGALGLGSKSPFCLVDSFKVASYHNGVCSEYCCYKDESGEPQIAMLTSSETDQPNGLEISMAIEGKESEFKREAIEVFKYFKQMPIINDQNVVDDIQSYKDSIVIKTDEYGFENCYGSTVAIMGNVAYEIPSEYDTIGMDGYIVFEIGELSFNPGREKLSLDQQTIAALKSKMLKINESLVQSVYDKINSKQTLFQKARIYDAFSKNKLGGIIRNSKLAKKFDEFDLPESDGIIEFSRGYRSSVQKSITTTLSLDRNTKYFKFLPRFENRVRQYVKSTGHKVILLTQEAIDKTKIDLDVIEDLNILPKSYKSPPSGSSKKHQYKEKVFIWNNCRIRDHRDRFWQSFDAVDTVPVEEKIYVVIHNNKIVSNITDTCSLSDFCNNCNKHIKLGSIYGIKQAFMDTKDFNHGNWISLEEYVKREFGKLNEINILPNRHNTEHLDDIQTIYEYAKKNNLQDSDYMIEFKNCIAEVDKCVTNIDKNLLGLFKVSVNDNVTKLYNDIMEKYGLIKALVFWRSDSDNKTQKSILKYIENTFAACS